MRDQQDFGGLLRRRRTEAQLTQEQLAELAGVSSRTVGDVERGVVRVPRKSSLDALADALALAGSQRTEFLQAARSVRWQPEMTGPVPVEAAPPVEPSWAQPRELPAGTDLFTGRARELETLNRHSKGSARAAVVAIVGIAGVGKTSLALRWAHRIADGFPDGQLYVNLRGYDPERPLRSVDALAGFLRSLGLSSDRIPVDEDEAAKLYRSLLADKRVLVVVDNARTPEQVRPLLPGSSGCLVVTTSRHSLSGLVARDGARRILLNVMPERDALALLTQALGVKRVGDDRARSPSWRSGAVIFRSPC